MSEASAKPKRVESIIINDDEEAPSLLNPLNGEVFVTNKVGLHVMELADGSRTLDDIVDLVVERFKGAQRPTVRSEVAAFLDMGKKKELLA